MHGTKKESKKNNKIAPITAQRTKGNPPLSDGYLLSDSPSNLAPETSEPRAKPKHPSGHVARRKASGNERIYWDDELPGFGLRVYATGCKRWIVQLRQRNITRRITLGDATQLSAPDAREAARKLLAQNALDGLPQRPARSPRSDPRFAAYAEEFWRDYARHWKGSTQKRNRYAIDKTLIPWFGRRHVGTILPADISAWKESLRDRQGVFNRDLPVLAAMLAYSEKLGYRPKGSNPCRGIARYKRQLPERYLTAMEYRRLAAALTEREGDWPDAVAAIRLLIYTGARQSEITSLRWEWVDPPHANLPDSKTGPKRLYLNRQALAILEARREKDGKGLVFPMLVDAPHSLPIAWRAMRRMAAIPDVRLHDLRHSFASIAIMDGIPLARVGKLLGHLLPETTARYAHLADAAIADAAARVSGSIAAALGLRT